MQFVLSPGLEWVGGREKCYYPYPGFALVVFPALTMEVHAKTRLFTIVASDCRHKKVGVKVVPSLQKRLFR